MADDIPQDQRLPDEFFNTSLQGVVLITTPSPVEGELAQFETSKAETIRQLNRAGRNQLALPDAAGETITVDAEVVEDPASSPQELTSAMLKQMRQDAGLSQMDVAIAQILSQPLNHLFTILPAGGCHNRIDRPCSSATGSLHQFNNCTEYHSIGIGYLDDLKLLGSRVF